MTAAFHRSLRLPQGRCSSHASPSSTWITAEMAALLESLVPSANFSTSKTSAVQPALPLSKSESSSFSLAPSPNPPRVLSFQSQLLFVLPMTSPPSSLPSLAKFPFGRPDASSFSRSFCPPSELSCSHSSLPLLQSTRPTMPAEPALPPLPWPMRRFLLWTYSWSWLFLTPCLTEVGSPVPVRQTRRHPAGWYPR